MMACKTEPCLVLNLNSLPEFLTKSSALTLWCSCSKLFFDCLAMSNQLLNGRCALVVQNFDSAATESKESRGDRTRAKSKYQCSLGRKDLAWIESLRVTSNRMPRQVCKTGLLWKRDVRSWFSIGGPWQNYTCSKFSTWSKIQWLRCR